LTVTLQQLSDILQAQAPGGTLDQRHPLLRRLTIRRCTGGCERPACCAGRSDRVLRCGTDMCKHPCNQRQLPQRANRCHADVTDDARGKVRAVGLKMPYFADQSPS
jgi:hypothetical protein